jgi:hypothetical protein
MMLRLSDALGVTINKAIRVLLRLIGFGGLHEPIKKTVLLLLRRQASLSKKAAPWPDLLPELLGLVLLRMPTHADQIRLCAVCRRWRSSARLQPLPPPLPWLALRDDRFLLPPDGAVLRMPLPAPAGDISYRVSTGRMLFLVHRDGSCCLMNPFSRETTPQQIDPDALDLDLCTYSSDQVRKVVVSDRIVALLTSGKMNNKNVNIFARGSPRSCSSSTMEWAPPTGCYAADIAIFQGKLYVLTAKHDQGRQPPELHVLDIGGNEQTSIRSNQCIRSTAREPCSTASASASASYRHCFLYLVACRDRLVMVNRMVDLDPVDFEPTGIRIEILEAADLSSGSGGRWSKVDTLMGHALFVSPGCSESLLAYGGGGGNGAREDCVYFTTERIFSLDRERKPEDDFIDCIVYNMRDRTLEPLPLETETALSSIGPWHPTWVFPAVI